MVGRSSFPQSRSASTFRPENVAQNALALIGNLCFFVFVFVFGLTIFTVIASSQSHFFHHSSKITDFLTSNSISDTGEDSVVPDRTGFDAFINLPILDPAVEPGPDDPASASDDRHCKTDAPIDCHDLDLFHLLMTATIEKFKDDHFYRFGKPVEGDNNSSCHMAWRYRPKDGTPGAFYKDYRAFTVSRSENCKMSVVGIGDYHSGENARKKKVKGKTNTSAHEVFEIMPIGEKVKSEGKYLIYSGGGDRCKSMRQYLWSFSCMLGEARYLNRTLVMDLSLCLSKIYSLSGVDEEGKDLRFFFDIDHLKDSAPVIDRARFWSDWNEQQEKDKLTLHLVEDSRVTPMKLADVKNSLVMRKFGSVEPDNYWYRVCEGEAGSVVQRPWHLIRKSRRLLDIASAISSRMNSDFDAIRVERGEKPESFVSRLRGKIGKGRDLYVATSERDLSIFDPLKGEYKTHFLDDYRDLWDVNTNWYDETTKLNNGNSVEFDGYMRKCVDTEVFLRGKMQIESFNDLSNECKDGINECTSSSS